MMNRTADNILDRNIQSQQRSIIPIYTPAVLVVFDRWIEDLNLLYTALQPGSIGYTIKSDEDAINKITALLSQTGAKKLAIVAHGEAGIVKIGAHSIDLVQLQTRTPLLQEWCLDEILLYSCEVGKGDRGQQFIQQLSAATGSKIAASATKVGAAKLGGNWNLTDTTGEIAANLVFQPELLSAYPPVLKAGDLDPGFGTNGKVIIDFNAASDIAKEVFVQADKKIIVAGASISKNLDGTAINSIIFTRLNIDGTIDPTFGANGKIVANIDRFNSNGSIDTTFGIDGRIVSNAKMDELSPNIKLQSDGSILLVGTTGAIGNGNTYDFEIARYLNDGTPVTPPTPAAINGTAGNETLNGTSKDDVINGLAGKDTLNGGDGYR